MNFFIFFFKTTTQLYNIHYYYYYLCTIFYYLFIDIKREPFYIKEILMSSILDIDLY